MADRSVSREKRVRGKTRERGEKHNREDRIDLDTILVDKQDVQEPTSSTNKTSSFITKYEYAAIIYKRAKQIEAGDTIYIDPEGEYDPVKIAVLELEARAIPLILERELHPGKTEVLKIRVMNIRDY